MIKDNQSNNWNNFITGQKPVQFLQSWQWSEFQEGLNQKIFKLKNDWGQALIVKHDLPFNKNYLYCPRGPILKFWNDGVSQNFLNEIKELAKKEKSMFLKIEPPILDSKFPSLDSPSRRGGQVLDSRKAADVQPSQTIILDLTKSEEELLAAMHHKTRYNIRLASRHGVKIREVQPDEADIFLTLLRQTARRDRFNAHPAGYYRQLLAINSDFVKLYFAEYKDEVLAAHIYVFFGDTITYVHGASSNELKNVMAPYLLHWETIKKAKALGYHHYDFWGINQKKWPGITRFKINFGGQIINYPGTFDLVFNQFWYQLYTISKTFF